MSTDSDRVERLAERLAAVERAFADADGPGSSEPPVSPDGDDGDPLVDRVDGLEERLADLEAAVQAVRGYVGDVRNREDDRERRVDAAVAKADALEARVASLESGGSRPTARRTSPDGTAPGGTAPASRATADGSGSTRHTGPDVADGRSEPATDDGGILARVRDSV